MSTQRQAEIVQEALALLDEEGLEGVTMRAVAKRLDVRLNTVSWHIGSKTNLLDLMADAILADFSLAGLPHRWDTRLRELTHRYQAALLGHRDGAALVAGTYPAREHTLRVGEAFVSCLLDAGCTERDAAWACWTIIYFTLGLTQEQQRAPEAIGSALGAALSPTEHPALSRTASHLSHADFAARHDFGLSLILDAIPTDRKHRRRRAP